MIDAVGGRPRQVVLATRLLALNLAFHVLFGVLVAFRFSLFVVLFHGVFIALIWSGVRWARTLFLLVVACHAAMVMWGVLPAMTFHGAFSRLSIGLVIELCVAYLLCQRESRTWFNR